MEFNYLYGKQAEQFAYVNIPKALIHEEAFSDISLEAKMLYGLIMERMGMYRKNKWQDEQGRVYSRIAEVENILANCVVIEESDLGSDYVRLGATVTVLDKEFDEEATYKIVGSQEADPMNGAISEDSPFGKVLLGKHAGDDVVVDAPAGPIAYKILKIEA